MDRVRKDGQLVRRSLMVALVLALIIAPLFYHFIPFLLVPILIPLVAVFSFVYFTSLTDFEKKKMIILNIVLAILFIGAYEGYLYISIMHGSHAADIHLNIAVWLVQIIAVNFLFVLYQSVRSLNRWRKAKKIEEMEQSRPQVSEKF